MAPKRPSPLDEPPTASSEEEETSSEEEEEEEEESKGGSSDEEEEAKDETTPQKNTVTLAPVTEKKPAIKDSEPQSSTSESGLRSDSETDDESAKIVKPVASKPDSKGKKPSVNVLALAASAKSSVKRTSDSDGGKESKRAKKKVSEADAEERVTAGEKSVNGSKKLFQRLWSEADEIAILKGMIDYTAKKGSDPTLDMNAFHDFIRHSLHVDVSRSQVMDKIRRLKKKYKNNVERGKEGEDPKFSNLHEQKAFELSNKVWGAEGISKPVEPAKTNGTARKKQDINNKSLTPLKRELFQPDHAPEHKYKMQLDVNAGSSDQRNESVWFFEKYFSDIGFPVSVLYKGLELVGPAKRAELEEEWKKLQVAELELFVSKVELVRDQGKLILEAYKSSCK